MNARRMVPLSILVLLVLILAPPVHSETGIIIGSADAIRQEGVRLETGLDSVTSSINPRVLLQYANTKREERVAAPPSALQTLFAQVSARIVLQYANNMRHERIAPLPAALQSLFGQMEPRIILQYANTSRQVRLAYPAGLIGDTVPPQISNVQVQSVTGGVKITWTTDEFATSEVRYGTAPEAYSKIVSDPLLEKTHSVTLAGLSSGATYYFVVRGEDRNGNQAASGEYQFKVQTKRYIYLPMLRR